MTNLDRWNQHLEVIKTKLHDLLCSFKAPVGPAVYKVDPRGNMETWLVLALRYDADEFRVSYSGRNPTNLELLHIAEAAKKNPTYGEERVRIIVTKATSSGKSSQALTMEDFKENWFFNQVNASLVSKQRKEARQAEHESIMAGAAIQCEFCMKVIPVDKAISRPVPSLRYGTSNRQFCSESCHNHYCHAAIR